MKKVGLVTLYEADNFGTCLQAYALQKTINEMGYECDIVRFDRNIATPKESKGKKIAKLGLRQTLDIALSRKVIQKQKERFAEFRREQYSYSQCLYSCVAETSKADVEYDAFVTGSDMVWSWESRKFLDYYFLKFCKSGKRISYAPSFGNTNFNEEMMNYYSEAIRGIDYCSCREKKGQQFINEKLQKKCILAADPTLLLSSEKWNTLTREEIGKSNNILVYIFGEIPRETQTKIKQLESRGYTLRYIPQMLYQYRYEKNKGNAVFGPIEFLKAFNDASFVITNTYHGLMFSLIYKKPFVLYHRDQKEHWNIHEERMQSVLDTLNLQRRYLYFGDEIKTEYLKLDYRGIDTVLNEQVRESVNFLCSSLKAATNGGIPE